MQLTWNIEFLPFPSPDSTGPVKSLYQINCHSAVLQSAHGALSVFLLPWLTLSSLTLHLQRASGPRPFALSSTAEHFRIIHLGLLSLHVTFLLQQLQVLSMGKLHVFKVQNKPCHFTFQEISCGTS